MTTMAEAREAIYARFKAEWLASPGPGPLTAYFFDNEGGDPPAGAPWARCTVRHRTGGQETLGVPGNRKFTRLGSVLVQLFAVTNKGTASMDELGPAARALFEGRNLAGTTVRFGNVSFRELGTDSGWYAATVEAEFEYDEVK
jgi:hypothetical protein